MKTHALTRRRFLQTSATLATTAALPTLVPQNAFGAAETILIGFIGCGGRANQLMNQVPAPGRIVAAADCFQPRAEASAKKDGRNWDCYTDFRKILDRKDIDVAFIPTTDHARSFLSIHACMAGKDVYAEKPLTVCIGEGRAIVNAARKYKRVFQVGSQQRTMEINRFACDLIRKGGLGKLKVVSAVNYTGPGRYNGLPKEEIPAGLDWDAWCNQTELRPYNRRLHLGWMAWRSYSGGEMTNWGAHGVDQIQWALGKSETGPVEIQPVTPGPNGKVSMRYDDGTLVRFEREKAPMGGAVFVGTECKMEVNRNKFATNPKDFVKNPPEPAVAQKWEGPGWTAKPHIANFLECVKTREKPNADVEIGHRSISVCHLANLARELGRKLQWNPETERFVDDPEADTYLMRPRRPKYELPTI